MGNSSFDVVFGDLDLEWSRPLRSALRNEGVGVSAATNTRDVLAQVDRYAPDVVVVGDGLEPLGREVLVRLIQDRLPRARIILILPESSGLREVERRRLGLWASFSHPVALPELRSAIGAPDAQAAAPGERPRLIMCVDDDRSYLDSVVRMLRHHGHSAVGFEDPEQALEAIPVVRPDLILLDVLMPGMNGLDFADQVREQYADAIPLVLLTGRVSDQEIAEGYRRGAVHYLAKPCDPRAVLSVADYLLGGPAAGEKAGEATPLPPGPEASGVPDADSVPEPPPPGRRHLVVCVDDEPQILSSLRRLLRQEPYDLLTTERPAEALAWVRERDVSVLITDQRMPEMEGTRLLEEACRESPVTARILLTGFPGNMVRIQGLRQGIQFLMYKPWDDDGLRRILRRLLHERELREGRPDAAGRGRAS